MLTNSERYILSLGLNFRPTPRILYVNVLNQQLDEFVRSVRIIFFFFVIMFVCTHANFTSCVSGLCGLLHYVLCG